MILAFYMPGCAVVSCRVCPCWCMCGHMKATDCAATSTVGGFIDTSVLFSLSAHELGRLRMLSRWSDDIGLSRRLSLDMDLTNTMLNKTSIAYLHVGRHRSILHFSGETTRHTVLRCVSPGCIFSVLLVRRLIVPPLQGRNFG